MDKLDLTKKYKYYYTANAKPELVDIDTAQFLSITGKGDPSEKKYADKIQALYSTAYAVKFIFKLKGKDFTVSKLECLWWFDEKKFSGLSIAEAPRKVPRSDWEYRMLIRLPDFVTNPELQKGIQTTISKKRLQLANDITLFEMREGKSVQMLHIGPFDTEPETLSQMDEFMQANHLLRNGLHHEIYLSDFRKVTADKMKTILREPVK